MIARLCFVIDYTRCVIEVLAYTPEVLVYRLSRLDTFDILARSLQANTSVTLCGKSQSRQVGHSYQCKCSTCNTHDGKGVWTKERGHATLSVPHTYISNTCNRSPQ